MMQAYRTEGNYRSAARLSPAELRTAMANREILQDTALAFDTQRQLRFEIGGIRAVMPFAQCADGAENGTVRDIAVLTRVGRPTCFVIESLDTDETGQPVYRLSGGQKKLASIAGILTLDPALILMDEPSAALDPRNRRALIGILNALPCAKLIASHDLDFIYDTCDRVLLLHHGQLAAGGPAREILRDKALLERCELELPLRWQRDF